jgi:iron complex outermembrane receptor protein
VDTSLKERALFGEISYKIMPELTFTAGARLFEIKLRENAVAIVAAGGGAGRGAGPTLRTKDNGLIGRFNLAYKVSDQVNTYVQVAQGYRTGGTNDQTAAAIANVIIPNGYGSDALWNYEFGVKTTLMDRKLFLNGAVYYIDWSDIQVTNQATNGTLSFPYTANGGKADVRGAELVLDARPVEGLQLTLTGNYSLARLTQDNPIASTGMKGDRIPYVPKWSGATSVSYSFPVGGSGLDGVVGADASYQGAMATKFNPGIDNFRRLDDYVLVGLRAGVSHGPWAVNLTVTNLLDDNTTINYNDIVPGVYPDGLYINRPRTVSLAGSIRF